MLRVATAMKHLLVYPLLASALISVVSAEADKTEKEVKPIIAVYDLEGLISESGGSKPSMLDFPKDVSRPLTMLDLTQSLEEAVDDPAVKAVVVNADGATFNFSQIQEIRRLLMELRDADKDVWLYSEHLTNGMALLGSAANHFTLMPESDCEFHGINAESMYFKGMLDKVGVRAEVIHIGDFKSYGETFYRTGPSDEAKQQEEKLIDSIFNQVVQGVAEGRKLEPAKVRALIDDSNLNAKKALEAGLVDHLMFRTELVKKLRTTYGKNAKFNRSYELPDLDGPEITGIMDLFKLFSGKLGSSHVHKDFVAVVALEGDITEESVAPVRTEILKLAKDEKAKALVLRVNSPGGSALASEILWEATHQWKATGKPFVVSMGGVAASGGYYVSSDSNRIFAEAGTITGSIGVVGMKFVIAGALDKLGISTHSTQRGKNAGAMSMTRGFTEEEATSVRKAMTDTYTTFKKHVTEGRGKALKGDLEPLAGGRVYSGEQALEIGLIDEIGGLHEAVDYAADAANLDDPDVRLVPEPKSGLEELFAKPNKRKDDEIIRASTSPGASARLHAALLSSGLTEALPEPAKAAVSRLISRVAAFQKTQILLISPDFEVK